MSILFSPFVSCEILKKKIDALITAPTPSPTPNPTPSPTHQPTPSPTSLPTPSKAPSPTISPPNPTPFPTPTSFTSSTSLQTNSKVITNSSGINNSSTVTISIGLIVGLIIGLIVVISIIIFTIIFVFKKIKKSKQSKQQNEIELQTQNSNFSNENNHQQQTTQYKSIQNISTNHSQSNQLKSFNTTSNTQYQQIPDFLDQNSINNNNQYVGMSVLNQFKEFKIPKSIEIDISELKFEKKLGEGNFGVVFQAKFNSKESNQINQNSIDQNEENNSINQNEENTKIVACKLLKSNNSIGFENGKNENIPIDNKELKEFIEEAQIMMKIPKNNNHVIKMIGICAQPLCIVSEYIDGGNLKQYLSTKQIQISLEEAIEYIKQICEGLQHLHQNQIIHR